MTDSQNGRSQTIRNDPAVCAWRDAFSAANEKQPDQIPTYEHGWYVFRSSLGWITSRIRRSELERMTKNLWERANAPGNQYG